MAIHTVPSPSSWKSKTSCASFMRCRSIGSIALVHHARRAVGRADPHRAIARDMQREDEIARQAGGRTEETELAVLHLHQPARGADPQRSVESMRERADLVAAGQSVRRVVVLDDLADRATAATRRRRCRPTGCRPFSASRLRIESPGRPSALRQHIDDLAVLPAIQAAAGADPDAAVAALHDARARSRRSGPARC